MVLTGQGLCGEMAPIIIQRLDPRTFLRAIAEQLGVPDFDERGVMYGLAVAICDQHNTLLDRLESWALMLDLTSGPSVPTAPVETLALAPVATPSKQWACYRIHECPSRTPIAADSSPRCYTCGAQMIEVS